MNKKRLLKLADFLETIPRGKFTLDLWRSAKPDKPEGKREGSCGFAGCAIGWAAHAKLFRGLKLVAEQEEDGSEAIDADPVYRGMYSFDAIDELFGLDPVDHWFGNGAAEYLFLDTTYPRGDRTTPKQVAKRIRDFVKSDGAIR